MPDEYPERRPPDLKVAKRRGVTAAQLQMIQERLVRRAEELVGSEMVFDLIEEAKVTHPPARTRLTVS